LKRPAAAFFQRSGKGRCPLQRSLFFARAAVAARRDGHPAPPASG